MTTTTTSAAKTIPARSAVPVELTWDLTPIYASEADWEADYQLVDSLIPKLAAYKGRLRRSGRLLLEAFRLRDEIYLRYSKVSVYARMSSDVDMADSHFQGLTGRTKELGNRLSAAMSFWSDRMAEPIRS